MRYPHAFAAALSPAPIGPFPPPAHRTRRADFPHRALQWDHASRTRNAEPGTYAGPVVCVPPVLRNCTALPALNPVQRVARPVYALTTSGLPKMRGWPDSFAYACDASGLPAHSRGDSRQSHSRRPSPFRHRSAPEAPFLGGHYPASSVVRASPPPCRPGLPLTGFRLPRARHRQRFPCCYAFHLPYVPTPLPRRKPAVLSVLSSRRSAAFP